MWGILHKIKKKKKSEICHIYDSLRVCVFVESGLLVSKKVPKCSRNERKCFSRFSSLGLGIEKVQSLEE